MNKLILIIGALFLVSFTDAQYLHNLNKDLPCINKKYHVFVHMIQDSLGRIKPLEQVYNVIQNANIAFSPICVSFELCNIDTIKDYNFNNIASENEIAELSHQYSAQQRINIYIISGFLINPLTYGYCTGTVFSMKDANICLLNPNKLSHELGHFFGLLDTYQNQDELVNGSNCEIAGDLICDTPADPYDENTYDYLYIKNCIFFYLKKDINDQFYQPDVGNIMSYFDCEVGFTYTQYLKMATNYYLANKKHW